MGNESVWGLIGIIIALAAYIATVRYRIIDANKKITGEELKDLKHKKELVMYALLLILAEAPLVFAGLLIALPKLWFLWKGTEAPLIYFTVGIILFGFSLLVLAGFHIWEWKKSGAACIDIKKRLADAQ